MSEFDWDAECAKARDEFLRSDSSYQTTSHYAAGRDAWNACMDWVKRVAILQMLGVPASERRIDPKALARDPDPHRKRAWICPACKWEPALKFPMPEARGVDRWHCMRCPDQPTLIEKN